MVPGLVPGAAPYYTKGTTMKVMGWFIGVVSAVVLIVALAIGAVSILDKEADARNLVSAQQKVVETSVDRVWKIISQKAQIAEKYADDFKEIYPEIMAERYPGSEGGQGSLAMMNWVVEHNPELDSGVYKDLMNSIEAERHDLQVQQDSLVAKDMEHNKMFDRVFTGTVLRLFGREKTEIILVTSDRTKEIFDNGGSENDISVFSSEETTAGE